MVLTPTLAQLIRVFGSDSKGDTPEQRARNSSREFVRSQDHLALATPEATGRRITAWEAFRAFGFDKLEEVIDHGSAVLVVDPREPAATIRRRRETLELEPREVAQSVHLSKAEVENAERPDRKSSIRVLEKIASALGLDETRLSLGPDIASDEVLAFRLRQMKRSRPEFSANVVLHFDEAAWVTRKQAFLSQSLFGARDLQALGFQPDSRYGDRRYPAWQCGYDLAHSTRRFLGLSDYEPIECLRDIVETTLRIPLIHLFLPKEIAGATVATSQVRGIVVNINVPNENVWVGRATIAHELGHLLWDPDQSLKSLLVDRFSDFEEPPQLKHDPVEARANAFAIEFLAPQSRAREIFQSSTDRRQGLRAVMEYFGISFTSAKFQVWNAFDRKVPLESLTVDNFEPTDEWKGRESFTVDIFRPKSVPQSRRGYFAALVVRALNERLISRDSAASFLGCAASELDESVAFIEQAFGPFKRENNHRT